MKRLPTPALLLAAALLGAAGAARAESAAAGAQPYSFLQLDSSARSDALGGAYTALASDANALQYNPGGLGLVRENEASFMYNQYFQSASQEHGEAVLTSGFGASYDMLNYGTLDRTTYSSPNGGLGTFSIVDSALAFGYGHEFGAVSLGAAGKLIRENNAGTVGQAWAVDAGALWESVDLPGLRVGAAAQNLGPKVRFQSAGETLPVVGRLGAAFSFDAFGHRNLITADASKEGTDIPRLSAGVETVAGESLALRFGFTTRNQSALGISAGFGWRGSQWSVDYAIAPYGDLGLTNRVSVGLRWGSRQTDRIAGIDPIVADALRGNAERTPAPEERLAPAARVPEVKKASAEEMNGPTPAERIARAGMMLDADRLAGAEQELAAAAPLLPAEDPMRVGWHEARGRLRRARGDLAGARAEYSAALILARKLGRADRVVADADEGMALTLADQGLYEYAVKFLRKAEALAPRRELTDLIEKYERKTAK